MKKEKWENYFVKIRNKYNLRMNSNTSLVIFLDGKNITRSFKHNLLEENVGSFNDILEQTIEYFTEQYNCIAISGADEVSFIFENSRILRKFISEKRYKSQDIVSIFSQCFYKYFNDRYKLETVYWHCKCLNIPNGKIKSYIKYRSTGIFELQLTYFLKRKQLMNAGRIPLNEKIQKCIEIIGEKEINKLDKGKLYINGKQVDLENFFNNQITNIPKRKREELITFLDINNF